MQVSEDLVRVPSTDELYEGDGDAIMNIKHEPNWKFIRERKQKLIEQNNKKENVKRISHDYKVGKKVLYHAEPSSKFGADAYEGPYKVAICRFLRSVEKTDV